MVSRAVKEGLVAFRRLKPAPNHQQQLKNPQHHPYPPRIHAVELWRVACDVSVTSHEWKLHAHTGQASALVVSRAVKEGIVAFIKLTSASNHH